MVETPSGPEIVTGFGSGFSGCPTMIGYQGVLHQTKTCTDSVATYNSIDITLYVEGTVCL